MATFKCIRSGNEVSFENQYDIEQMRKQTMDYIELEDEGAVEAPRDPSVKQHDTKRKQRVYKGHPDVVGV